MAMQYLRNIKDFFTELFERFSKNKTSTWAASLAFYMALSLAPLLILFLAFSAQLSVDLQGTLIEQADQMLGPIAANGLSTIIQNAQTRSDLISFSGLIGTLTLLLSASLIFDQLRKALNQFFDREEQKSQDSASVFSSIWEMAKSTLIRVSLVIFFIAAVIVTLVATTFITVAIDTDEPSIAAALNIFISLTIYILLFTGLFHYLPNGTLPWRQSLQGGTLTALLFLFGKELIGYYLGQSALSSSYGAAGSIVALLVWVYYSALIIFLGAHVSYVLQKHFRKWA